MPSQAVGIDLGTTNSCIAVFRNGSVEILKNDFESCTTPSVVAYTDKKRLVGEEATNQFAVNAKNTIFNVKRLIGQKCDDPKVREDIKNLPYNVISSPSGRAVIEVMYKNEERRFTPEQVSAVILADLKKTAENVMWEVKDAVITVPAYFNNSQRQATKDAGEIAGFNVLSVINEPTAAAIAYGLELKSTEKRNILVYDLGGGTFDVTILEIEGAVYDVKSTSGNVHLGGEDFDNRMVDYCANDIMRRYNMDIRQDPRGLRRLRTACEQAKRRLSSETDTTISLDALVDGKDYSINIDSSRFESLCQDFFDGTLETVRDALDGAGLKESEIEDVVLVGGSTRIPRIQQLLSEFFGGKKLSRAINPDEAVAHGAAICAAVLTGNEHLCIRDIVLKDVAPLSLGTDIMGNRFSIIIPRNTKIPTKKSATYTTTVDNQTSIPVEVIEGQRKIASENNLLGSFQFGGIRPAPRGVAKIEVTYELDKNGILKVSATDKSSGNRKSITIENKVGNLTKEEIARIIADEEKFKVSDMEYEENTEAKNELIFLIQDVEKILSDEKMVEKATTEQRERLAGSLRETKEWLDKNSTSTKSKYEAYTNDLRRASERFNDDIKWNDLYFVD